MHSFDIRRRSSSLEERWELELARLADLAGDRLEITTSSTAHVTVRVSEVRRAPGDATASGFSIARTYLDAAGQPATSFEAGDLVTVQLAVAAAARHRWTHQKLRDDRVEWFANDMPSGGDTLTYQARATIDGSFTAMPATIEAMYQPDQHARTPRTQITVAK
ncbi:MAG TPA: hypothetical protein VF469_06005 [Kofleriaceae bacterium]